MITTSESVIFEMVGDARRKEFRDVAALVKLWKAETRWGVGKLCGGSGGVDVAGLAGRDGSTGGGGMEESTHSTEGVGVGGGASRL